LRGGHDQRSDQPQSREATGVRVFGLNGLLRVDRVVSAMARALADSDWDVYTIRHAQRGRLTLADVLALYADHSQFHLAYFRRNLDAFRAASTR